MKRNRRGDREKTPLWRGLRSIPLPRAAGQEQDRRRQGGARTAYFLIRRGLPFKKQSQHSTAVRKSQKTE